MNTSLHKSADNQEYESTGDEESCVEEMFLQVGAGKNVHGDDDRMNPTSPNQNIFSCSTQVDDQVGSTKSEMDEVMEENQRLKMYLDRILKDYRTLQTKYRDVIQLEAEKSHPRSNHVDLSLGMSSITDKKSPKNEGDQEHGQDLSLGLDCRADLTKKSPARPENSIKDGRDGDDEAQQNPTKRARVSVRVRCDTPTMNDGCQWRKYGQKIAKGNPCPRAYYRCTVAPSCPVRKQVQRCAEDMSILTTTYEGTHNHPLPISATAMASTTSAAASMLLSGSSTSSAAAGGTLNGLNFYHSDISSKPFYLPNSSSPSFPTITLDLTTSPPNRLGKYAPTHLNFSSFDQSNPPPFSWNNGHGSSQPLIKNQTNNSQTLGSQSLPYETLNLNYLQKTLENPSQHSDTLAKAITSNPNFQSVLTAALSSIINGGSSANYQNAPNSFPILSSFNPPSSNASFMNNSSSSVLRSPTNTNSKSNSPSDIRDHTN